MEGRKSFYICLMTITFTSVAWSSEDSDPTKNSRYSYLQGHYIVDQELEVEGEEVDGDGFGLGFSYHFYPRVFGFARGDLIDFDDNGGDADVDSYSIGIGFRQAAPRTDGDLDLYSEFSYQTIDVEATASGADFDLDADGYGVTAGLRWMATSIFELNPYFSYIDYGSVDGNFNGASFSGGDFDGVRFGVRGVYEFAGAFAVVGDFERGNLDISGDGGSASYDETTLRLGLRYYLGGGLGGDGGFRR